MGFAADARVARGCAGPGPERTCIVALEVEELPDPALLRRRTIDGSSGFLSDSRLVALAALLLLSVACEIARNHIAAYRPLT